MSQKCGNCIYLDPHDKKEFGNWFSGYHDEFYCRDLHKYVSLEEGYSCRYFRELPRKSDYSGCFITTAVVNIYGYSDNCEILTILREFRNNVLQKSQFGIELLKEYDVVGPIISKKLYEDKNNTLVIYKLLSAYLYPIVEYIKKKDYNKAVDEYIHMINYLKVTYNVFINSNEYEYDFSVKKSEYGHGTARVHKVSVKA